MIRLDIKPKTWTYDLLAFMTRYSKRVSHMLKDIFSLLNAVGGRNTKHKKFSNSQFYSKRI